MLKYLMKVLFDKLLMILLIYYQLLFILIDISYPTNAVFIASSIVMLLCMCYA
jgi:hypothetical protein